MSATDDVYMLPDGTTVSQPAGTPAPAGGTLVAGPDFNKAPAALSSAAGVSSSAISNAAASPASGSLNPFGTPLRSSQYQIPVWRDAEHSKTTAFQSSGPGSANAVENAMTSDGKYSANSSSSANAVDNARQEASSYVTPQMFDEKGAYNEFATILMDPAKFKQVTDTLVQNGFINPGQTTDVAVLQNKWDQLVKLAVDIKQLKGLDMTPLEVAQMYGQNSGAAMLANQNYVKDHLTGTRVQNDQTIDEKTPSQTTLRDLLGHNPTDAELIAYNHGVEQTAAAHPLNREIQTHYVQGQPDSQSITYTGGYDQQAAESAAAHAASPEVAQNQAATTYYNALVNAIRPAA